MPRALSVIAACCLSLFLVRGTQDAIANGDTRSLELYHAHTRESIHVTFRRNGAFDQSALEKLNWFLRDWRMDEPTSMAPGLFDIVWAVYRESGAREPIKVVSAYRSPGTNEMLRRRSRAVAKDSQHTRGNAMDLHIPGISMAKAREVGMRLQRGGVGYYPTAGSPFVHLDVGTVRSWPRMTRDQLERLFPDGKTVHLPADGKPLANYELALAEVQARGGSALDYGTVTSNSGKSLWALLFGGDGDEDKADPSVSAGRSRVAARPPRGRGQQPVEVASAPSASPDSVMVASVVPVVPIAPRSVARAETVVRPLPVDEVAQPPEIALKAEPQSASVPVAGESVALPIPPIRPKGEKFEQMVAALEPLPPIRPLELKEPLTLKEPIVVAAAPPPAETPLQPIAGLPLPPLRQAILPEPPKVSSVAAATTADAQAPAPDMKDAPKLIAGMPMPPQRLAQTVQTATAPASLPSGVALPGIMAGAPEQSGASQAGSLPPLVQSYAAYQAPQPPARPVVSAIPATVSLGAPAKAAAQPRLHDIPQQRRLTVRAQPDPSAKQDQRSLTSAQRAADMRPDYVVNVIEPPVSREINSGVVASRLSKASVPSGGNGFAGNFIRPLGASFTKTGQ